MKNKKSFSRAAFFLILVNALFFSNIGLPSYKVEAANENNPPSKIDVSNIFTTPTTGSSSKVTNGNMVEITNSTWQKGGIWSTEINKMDLTRNFTSSMYMYFGNNGDSAADGMAFVMHNDARGTNATSTNTGGTLGVWGWEGNSTKAIQKSFAVEFDTWHNNSDFDYYVSNKDHIAWNFPGRPEAFHHVGAWGIKHNDIQYTTGNLANDVWRKFTITWDAAGQKLTYQLAGTNAVTVPIDPMVIFGSTSVYWGFTGATGENATIQRTTFDSVPGLVNADLTEKITRNDGSVVNNGDPVYKGEELTYSINAKYLSGKQDWMNLIANSKLNDHVTYIPESMTLTTSGTTTEVEDSVWSGKSFNLSLPNMNSSMNDITISYKVKVNEVTVDTPISEIVNFVGSNYITNTHPVIYVIQANNVPEVTITEKGPIHLAVGEDYQAKGTWKDSDDSTNTLYYDLNGELLKSEVLDNGGSTEPVDWSYLITSDQLKLGENNLQVTAKDGKGAYSVSAKLKIIVESPPAITLTDANREIPVDFGTEYTMSGSWNDLDSNLVDLYYAVDSNTPVKFASNVSNSTNKGEDINYQYSIPADQLSIGMHQVSVYAVDDTGRKSNIEVVNVNVTGKLSFMSVTENVSFENMKVPNQPTYSKRNDDWEILVKDTRGLGSSWRLTATLMEEFSDSQGHFLRDALKFVNEDGIETTMALGAETNVYEMITQDEQNISINWESDKGILLKIDPFVYIGNYTGKINWNLIDAP
ncbi:L-type lectin-domain containing protein [Peribacillus frigoritolerans]|uniref:L-type lectin-domain containing protein n=1 Tax=Peribacillus frigoritolerans TaxID=450367 RepID=UPI003D32CFE2